jgi:hypothetical protein
MIVDQLVERITGETDVFGENLPNFRSFRTKSQLELEPTRWEAND